MEINKGHYKKLLEDELRTLESELKTVGRINPDNPKDWEPTPAKMDTDSADQNEVADTIEEFEENAAILKQLEIRFNEVKEGLVRIESGNYGVCKTERYYSAPDGIVSKHPWQRRKSNL